jgi:hypothetical protein
MEKALSVGLMVLLLILSMPTIAITVHAGKPNNAPPEIEKITFVHYATDHSKPVWDDTVTDYRFIAGGVRWFNTISYKVNPSGSGLDSEVVRSTLEASSETWDSVTGFELFAPPTITSESVVSGDGKNTIGWSSLDPGIIAVTTIWYYPHNKTIVEFDTVFNTYYTWGILNPQNPDLIKMDLQNIATHEFGHNGLADLKPLKDAELTMYYASSLGETKKRSLGVGDILGIQALYGA